MDVTTNHSRVIFGISIKLVHKIDDIASKLNTDHLLFQPTHVTFVNIDTRLMCIHRML